MILMNAFENIISGIGIDIKKDILLAPFSTLKVGGAAQYFLTPNSVQEIALIQKACFEYGMPLHILSGGSNTLFSDQGFRGVVLKLGPSFDEITVDEQNLTITAKAGSSFAKLTKIATGLGFAPAVGFSGVPGLVGGATRMNAGTKLGELGEVIEEVYGVFKGEYICLNKKELLFSYRHVNLPKDFIVEKIKISYPKNLLQDPNHLKTLVSAYKLKRKETQPTINSLGSFFKNPYPLFAAKLIENCHLKGLEYNKAAISSLHANFIINLGGASAKDILHLAALAQQKVFKNFGVVLHPEARMVGDFSDCASINPNNFSQKNGIL